MQLQMQMRVWHHPQYRFVQISRCVPALRSGDVGCGLLKVAEQLDQCHHADDELARERHDVGARPHPAPPARQARSLQRIAEMQATPAWTHNTVQRSCEYTDSQRSCVAGECKVYTLRCGQVRQRCGSGAYAAPSVQTFTAVCVRHSIRFDRCSHAPGRVPWRCVQTPVAHTLRSSSHIDVTVLLYFSHTCRESSLIVMLLYCSRQLAEGTAGRR